MQGIYRQDNHAWLFAWSNGTVFQVRALHSLPLAHPPGWTACGRLPAVSQAVLRQEDDAGVSEYWLCGSTHLTCKGLCCEDGSHPSAALMRR